MTACGARTWVTPDEVVTCESEHGHGGEHAADASFGLVGWREPVRRFVLDGYPNRTEHVWTTESTRALVARLQRQLDAIDPDAAITEAERRMLDARTRAHALFGLGHRAESPSRRDLMDRVSRDATKAAADALDAWLALVEARDAKGGGA